jgi:uncharacterized protein
LTRKEDVQRVAERLSTDSAITALVNNAGIGSAGKFLEAKIDDLESMIDLNVIALTRLVLAALPGFVRRKKGILINIASIVALAPELLNGTYSGSKAYVVNFTQALKNELEGTGELYRLCCLARLRRRFGIRRAVLWSTCPTKS